VTELLIRKLVQVRNRTAAVREALPADAEDVLKDARLEAFLSFNLFLAIQDAIDLATHLLAARGLGVPATQREVFTTLATAGLLSPETAAHMGQLASLRNRIAHAYGDVDPVRIVREAPAGLAVLDELIEELATLLPEP
jgi:uncharacterized protein YutE (UPF0331/DUF86 family)